ncbi:MAG TPA: vitamin B12-dependent ribonucleotide reductase, partial [Bacteroidota bacterium]
MSLEKSAESQTINRTSPAFAKDVEAGQKKGLVVKRVFTNSGTHAFDMVEWERRTASISNEKGDVIFEQKGVEVPKAWSMTATNVVASKYFHGKLDTPQRESSVRGLVDRVTRTITEWGKKGGYFNSEADAEVFYSELTFLCVNQYLSFNSPVWFNVGIEKKPQCSACFINSVKDTMDSILQLAKTEGLLFKWGSGTGSNLSTLRSSKENLSSGGSASGPVSFMKGYDAFAGVIKSGGKTRRAAKMVILNADHPDILEFINSKSEEEKKAWVLIEAGYDGGFNVPGGAYDSIAYQNANHSVRATDDFMTAVVEDKDWQVKSILTGKPMATYRARDLMRQIAEAAWICGDPGMQFHTTINEWNTCPNTAPINASNPCSEYMFLDDTACNLASLNLMKFRSPEGDFDIETFCHAVSLTITAQEILVDNASYPTPAIERNSFDYRPLGLGYANLGALLMSLGIPYDSETGRDYSAAVTEISQKHVPADLFAGAKQAWDEAVELGEDFGYR